MTKRALKRMAREAEFNAADFDDKVRRLPVESPRLVQVSGFTSAERSADVEAFDTHLYINGSIDEAQTESLLVAAANTCYAHRALATPVRALPEIVAAAG